MVFYFKACPRDKGDLHLENDFYGSYVRCMQCGYQKDVKNPPKPYAQNPFRQTQRNDLQTHLEENLAMDGSIIRILGDLDSRIKPATLNEIKKGTGLSEKTIEDAIDDIKDYELINVDFRNNGKEQYLISSGGRVMINYYLKSNESIKEEKLEEDSEQVKENKK